MTKYKQIFMEMTKKYESEFGNFKELHDNYVLDPKKYKTEFDIEGAKILDIIQQYENILCAKTDRGTYSKFSNNLSEKFRDQVRAFFPKIDFVGVKIS